MCRACLDTVCSVHILISTLSHVFQYQKTRVPQIYSRRITFFLFAFYKEQPLASAGYLLSCKHSSSYLIPFLWKSALGLLDQKLSRCKSVEVAGAEPAALARPLSWRQRHSPMTQAQRSDRDTPWNGISFFMFFLCLLAFIGASYCVCHYIDIFVP